jgi:hypothetical protein
VFAYRWGRIVLLGAGYGRAISLILGSSSEALNFHGLNILVVDRTRSSGIRAVRPIATP